jgi:hypothetical protein
VPSGELVPSLGTRLHGKTSALATAHKTSKRTIAAFMLLVQNCSHVLNLDDAGYFLFFLALTFWILFGFVVRCHPLSLSTPLCMCYDLRSLTLIIVHVRLLQADLHPIDDMF